MAKKTNARCPLQAECERKCKHEGHELDCDYYNCNARDELVIEDQEAIRRQREREREEQMYEEELCGIDYDEDDPEDTAETPSEVHIAGTGKLVMIPIEQLYPHPDNPRKELGDLTEIADSIRAKGVFQNLTVVPHEDGYRIIIGHRRRAASELAGLTHLPCVIVDMTPKEQVETMLLENMQREDLTVYEQAQGFQMMINMGDTPEGIAEKTGFSKKTVKRRLKMAELDPTTLKEVSSRQISLSDFDSLAKIDSLDERNKVLQHIGTDNFKMEYERSFKRQEIAKNMPTVKEALKRSKAKKIEQRDTWYGKYVELHDAEVKINELANDSPIVPESAEKLFYYLDESSGRLRFFHAAKKAAPVKRTQEEIDRDKAIKEAHEKLDELDGLTRKLRESFVNELRYTQKNATQMLKGAIDACICSAFVYSSISSSKMFEAVGAERKWNNDDRWEIFKLLEQSVDKEVPLVVYLAFCDTNEIYHTNYKSDWPRYQKNIRLDKLYEWLISLGYTMSDDEQALHDGTHELLHLGEKKDG